MLYRLSYGLEAAELLVSERVSSLSLGLPLAKALAATEILVERSF